MNGHILQDDYLAFKSGSGMIRIPYSFIKVLTPVYNEEDTLYDGEKRRELWTFHIWIYPSFANHHGIPMARCEKTGEVYATIAPTENKNTAHLFWEKLSEFHGFPDKLLYGKSWQ